MCIYIYVCNRYINDTYIYTHIYIIFGSTHLTANQ